MSDQWTAEAYPSVPPNEKFRHDLQRALEQTHRQQMAQRKLGTHGAAKHTLSPRRMLGVVALFLAAAIALRWLQGRAGRGKPVAA
jgi:hypothetical protein